ncbi:MAG TPA: LysM domain-containing protein [Desulfobacterales bacterium]|nr:LysM domain-containing protein [Desulfobacterales bacterium]
MSKFSPRKQSRKDKMPFVLMGACLLALIIFFLVVFSKAPSTGTDNQIGQSEGRLRQVEARLLELEEMMDNRSAPRPDARDTGQFENRLEALESSVSSRLDHIEKVLGNLQKKLAVPAPKNTQQTAKPVKRRAAPQKRTASRYHFVRPGETLYQISRNYALTVEALRGLNNLAPGASIHPGQKLVVSR